MKNILILSYHFYPAATVGAKRPSELALELAENGNTVSIVAAKVDGHDELKNKINRINVNYVPVPPDIIKKITIAFKRLKNSIIKSGESVNNIEDVGLSNSGNKNTDNESYLGTLRRRILSILAINDSLTIWCILVIFYSIKIRLSNKYDIIITSGPPMVVHNAGFILKKLFPVKWVLDMRDPFPVMYMIGNGSSFIDPDVISNSRIKIELYTEKNWLNAADMIVTASPGVSDNLVSRYDFIRNKTRVIYNGYDHIRKNVHLTKNKKLTFLYAGSLYYNRNPFPLFNTLKSLKEKNVINKNNILFLFFGECEFYRNIDLKNWLKSNKMDEIVKIYPPVSVDEINNQMVNADILINFCQGQPMQIPAKTFEYIGMGKPSLVFTEHDSDTASIVNESGSGIVIDQDKDDIEAIIQNILKNPESLQIDEAKIDEYSRKTQNRGYIRLIETL